MSFAVCCIYQHFLIVLIPPRLENFSGVHENGYKIGFQKSRLELFNQLHIFFHVSRNYLYTKTNFVCGPKLSCRCFLDTCYDPFDDIDDILITIEKLCCWLVGSNGNPQTVWIVDWLRENGSRIYIWNIIEYFPTKRSNCCIWPKKTSAESNTNSLHCSLLQI